MTMLALHTIARSPGRPARRGGFTLLELLIVLAVVMILAGLLVWALGAAGQGVKEGATQATFEKLRTMQDNWLRETSGNATLRPASVVIASSPPPLYMNEPLQAPGDVSASAWQSRDTGGNPDDPEFARYHAPAVQLTQRMLRQMSLAKGSSDILNGLTTEERLPYDAGVDPTYLTQAGGNFTTPIPADAWGNPIIYVPEGGLTGLNFEADGSTNQMIVAEGRGFWASAGPDGSFSAADDNLYSTTSVGRP